MVDCFPLQWVSQCVILDIAKVRGMAYYTGIAFHAYVAGLGSPICSGGRYDELIARFGANVLAVGLSLEDERSVSELVRSVISS
ncbi:MAG: hypothetical protein A2Y73_01820 [Chloroflexi bacterium RBG_13_56_8]|nr:MAG: hypothetical protein A2Y73_01820 [Chloroflexi bacterium RBG_13_56_8]